MPRRVVRKVALGLFIFSCSWTLFFVLFVDPDERNSPMRSLKSWFPDSPEPDARRPAPARRLGDWQEPNARPKLVRITKSPPRPLVAFASSPADNSPVASARNSTAHFQLDSSRPIGFSVSLSSSATSSSPVTTSSSSPATTSSSSPATTSSTSPAKTTSSSPATTRPVFRDVQLVERSAVPRRPRDPFDVWDSRGASVIFAVPECPSTNAAAPELAQQTFQRLAPSLDSAYFYSAFSDHRDAFAVRVVGVAQHRPLGDLSCQLYYGSVFESAVGETTITLNQLHVTDAFYSLVPEGIPKNYGCLELKCPGVLKDRVPLAVSLVPKSGSDPNKCAPVHNLLLVQTTLPYGTRIHPNGSFAADAEAAASGSHSRRERFAVCLPALNTNYDMPERLVEWLEFNRILGAKHVFFYNHTLGARAAAVIESYRRGLLTRVGEEGSPFNVSLLQWPQPAAVDLHYFSQTAVLNDCLLRAIRGFEYVAVADLDEFLVPHGAEMKTWDDLYERYFPRHPAASYMFRNAFFFQSFTDDPVTAQNATIRALNVMPLLKTMHEGKVWAPFARSKYMASTDLTQTVATHQIRGVLTGAKLPRDRGQPGPVHYPECLPLEPDVGLLHHYRVPFETLPTEGSRDRHVPDTYGDPLLRAVSLVRKRLHEMNVLNGPF